MYEIYFDGVMFERINWLSALGLAIELMEKNPYARLLIVDVESNENVLVMDRQGGL